MNRVLNSPITIEQLRGFVQNYDAEVNNFTNQINELNKQIAILKSENNESRRNNRNIILNSDEYRQLENRYQSLIKRNSNLDAQLHKTQQALQCLESTIVNNAPQEVCNMLANMNSYEDFDEMLKQHDLLCSICINPTTNKTNCNHPVCKNCIWKTAECPLCLHKYT